MTRKKIKIESLAAISRDSQDAVLWRRLASLELRKHAHKHGRIKSSHIAQSSLRATASRQSATQAVELLRKPASVFSVRAIARSSAPT
ncbi:MAG: hypothetical protein EBR09_15785 [Proteobacteria bacterium]|nr:hypothetical protein [Pseudomonadota bacterium]